MRPADSPALVELIGRGLYQYGTAEFLETQRRNPPEHKLAAFVKHDKAVLHSHHVDRAPAGFGHGLLVLPDALSGVGVEAAELAIAIDSIDVVTIEDRGSDHTVKALCALFVGADRAPQTRGGGLAGFVRLEPQHQRAVVEG